MVSFFSGVFPTSTNQVQFCPAAMGFPTSPDTKIRSRNDAVSIAALLKERHDGYFMIWFVKLRSSLYSMLRYLLLLFLTIAGT